MPLSFAWSVMVTLGAWTPQDASTKTAQSLDGLESVLQEDTSIAPATRKALLDLVQSLKAERQAPSSGQGSVTSADLEKALDEYLAKRKSDEISPGLKKALDRLSFFGDFRLRQEASVKLEGVEDRHRTRVRFRVGSNFQIADELQVGARLATGTATDANSPHQTLGDDFDKFDLNLDRVFATYRPKALNGSYFTAGKFAHGFLTNPVYGELVWDDDVQPEGVQGGITRKTSSILEQWDLRLGEYLLLEQGGNANDAFATVAQIGGTFKLCDSLKAVAGFSYYYYTDPSPSGSTSLVGDNQGNASVDLNGDGKADRFVSDFQVFNPLASLQGSVRGLPWVVSTEWIHNYAASGPEDSGWAIGASLGSNKKKGEWLWFYQWCVVEQDAIFSPVAQDDFLFATNMRSHIFGTNYQILDSTGLRLWAMVTRPDEDPAGAINQNQWRVRLDLNIRF